MKDYPLFIPPMEVSEKQYHDWTTAEAKLYFNWFISIKQDRCNYLMEYLEERLTNNHEEDLMRIGLKIKHCLFKEPFSQLSNNRKYEITNKGLAIAADIGILVSCLIIRINPKVSWKIWKKGKRDLSYNLPVMIGFSKIDYIEPIRISTADARLILCDEKGESAWWEMYNGAINSI